MAERQSTVSLYPPQPQTSVPHPNPDVFSDDYAVDSQHIPEGHQTRLLVADGSHDLTSQTKIPETPRRSLSFQRFIEPPLASSRLSRGSQRGDGRTSLSSRLTGRSSSRSSNPARSMTSMSELSNSASTAQRSTRTISTFGFPRSQSPYQGATGPSHPYGMYPQDIGLTRTPSTATASTVRRPERSYSGPSGPTQPYAMYSQNTVPEDDLNPSAGLAPPIVAGFPGRGQNYERRLGPEGEDVDDLIGPDGYTEQLPPYSRYANNVPPKYTSGIESLRRSAPEQAVPPQDSQETLHSSQTRDETGLVNPFADSSTQLDSTSNSPESPVPPKDEGGHFKERVRQRSKRKVCCGLVPCWLLAIIIIVICLAVLLGGVIGGVIAHERGEEKGRNEAAQSLTAITPVPTTTVTASFVPDAVPISSTPSGLPPLQTGTFKITLDGPSSLISNSCLTNPAQSNAWDCATGADLQIDITMTGANVPAVSLSNPTAPGSMIRYGAQPPVFHSPPVILSLDSDNANPNRGPAWSFVQTYTKVVIVRQQDLPGPSPGSKRSFLRRWFFDEDSLEGSANVFARDSEYVDDQVAKAGDQPWYCYWNGTQLEGFIFVTQEANTNGAESDSYPTAASTNAMTQAMPSAPHKGRTKRQASPDQAPFPYPVKIEERRSVYNPTQPYCQQMQVLYNQQLGFTVPGEDSPLTLQLQETEAPFQQKQELRQGGPPAAAATPVMSAAPTSLSRREIHVKRGANNNAPSCHCQWITG